MPRFVRRLVCFAIIIGFLSRSVLSTSCAWLFTVACTAKHHVIWPTSSRCLPQRPPEQASDPPRLALSRCHYRCRDHIGILYCSLGWYENHTSIRPAAVGSWKYMNKLRWQHKFSALLDWILLGGIVLVAFCSFLKSRLKSVRRRRRRRRSLQQPISVRKPCATCPYPPADMPFVTFAHERSMPSITQSHVPRHHLVTARSLWLRRPLGISCRRRLVALTP